MWSPILVLAGVGLAAVVALGILTSLIIGIRRGDHHHLNSTPKSQSDAFARRILVGIRYPCQDSEGNDK